MSFDCGNVGHADGHEKELGLNKDSFQLVPASAACLFSAFCRLHKTTTFASSPLFVLILIVGTGIFCCECIIVDSYVAVYIDLPYAYAISGIVL